MAYLPAETRYDSMQYRRTGRSGLLLPAVSLGIWYNFGGVDPLENARAMLRRAFDLGITHIDIANNYGPPPGSAEETFGRVLREDLAAYRDELVISNKAGYFMWPGPYGEWGSRKYLIASCDQSLKRTGLEYFDIFYSHRPDPNTPLEETMGALDYLVRSGRALYAGVSTYSPEQTRQAAKILRDLGTPCLIHQPRYNMFDRWIEDGLLDVLHEEGIGCIAFSPLCQGLLTNKYIRAVPDDSRAAKLSGRFHWGDEVSQERIEKVRRLNQIALDRGQDMAQMAVAWVLRHRGMTSALIGASRPEQIDDIVASLSKLEFSADELTAIDTLLAG
ncbi:MAG: L-glyceraldehyde 3-phosphate reductase [Anaerolineae bacterium]|nr:L-glyceraldehyde 3-phosphate reductase [Anaerolineae bacterium]NUQ02928.1 L-glyceraldehyde 3-phosphate reductase [Anaerolineae bacterium]